MNNPEWKRIRKKAKRGFRGYPVATVAFYGPDNKTASKVAIALIERDGAEASKLERWFSEDDSDIRKIDETGIRIDDLIKKWNALTVVHTGKIIGCPHEEGIDYPEGRACPECPFWENRDRWAEIVGK